MATETSVVSNHPTDQEVEKEVQSEEVKKMEAENVCPSEPHVILEEVKKIITTDDEKPKVLEAEVVAESPTKQKKIEDKEVEPIEEKKIIITDHAPIAQVAKEAVLEPTIEKTEEAAEGGLVEEKTEEPRKIVDVDVPKAEELLPKVVESKVVEAECKTEEPAPVVESKLQEESKVEQVIEKEVPEAAETVEKQLEVENLPKDQDEEVVKSWEQVKESSPLVEMEVAKETIEVVEAVKIQEANEELVAKCEAKAAEEEVTTSRDIELVANEKNKTVASAETTTTTTTVSEVEKKIEETVQATEAKIEEEKQVEEKIEKDVQACEAAAAAKLEEEKQVVEKVEESVQTTEATKSEEEKQNVEPDAINPESEETKTSQDTTPKDEVPVKTQKQSIVKMVKQSLVKAKKAIIGKSQNSKTPAAPEAKDDVSK